MKDLKRSFILMMSKVINQRLRSFTEVQVKKNLDVHAIQDVLVGTDNDHLAR